jgi:hypothetical protein
MTPWTSISRAHRLMWLSRCHWRRDELGRWGAGRRSKPVGPFCRRAVMDVLELYARQLGKVELSASKVSSDKVGAVKYSARKVGSLSLPLTFMVDKLELSKVALTSKADAEICAAEIGIVETGSTAACPHKVGASQIRG